MIRFLLRLYPAAWRKEYGEEFADILASSRLTFGTATNVIWSAGRQRLIHIPTWLPGGGFFCIFFMLPWWQMNAMLYAAFLGLLATSVWGAAWKRGSFAAGLSATATAMLFGFLPQVVEISLQRIISFSFTIWGHVFSGPLRLGDVPHLVFGLVWCREFGWTWASSSDPRSFSLLLKLELIAVEFLFFFERALIIGCFGALCGTAIKKVRRRLA